MTALCGGGPSSPQSGVGGVLTLGATAIEIFVSSVLGLPELAPIIAPIIAGLADIELAAYCSTDPPSDPGLTASDLEDALRIPPNGLATFTAQQKIVTWFESQYWYQICQCTSTTTPAASAPSNPGQISTNPGLPQASTPCWSVSVPYIASAHTSPTGGNTDLTAQALPAGAITPQIVANTTPPTTVGAVTLPAGINHIVLSATLNEAFASSPVQRLSAYFNAWTSTGTVDSTNQMVAVFNFTQSIDPTVSVLQRNQFSTLAANHAVYIYNQDTIQHTGTVTLSFYCAPGTYVGCVSCGPDPVLEGELANILQYVQAIYAALPVPLTSFAEATVHSGLTGNGSVTLADNPISIKVTLTTIPPWVGLDLGSPDFYFDVGFLSFATSEGNYDQTRVTLAEQLMTVPLLSGSIGYTLKNGVIASITELIRGP